MPIVQLTPFWAIIQSVDFVLIKMTHGTSLSNAGFRLSTNNKLLKTKYRSMRLFHKKIFCLI